MEVNDLDQVSACIKDVKTAVQSIAQFAERTVFIYDESDLADKIKGITKFPAAGIVYEGMRAQGAGPGSGNMGTSTELVISIILVSQPETMFNTDTKMTTIQYLTELRNFMLDRVAPSGHKWRFVVEAQAKPSKGLAFWVQRWTVPLQLQHNRRR